MKPISILLSILFFCSSTTVNAQKKYVGILFSKFGDKIEGTIKVNLDGPNGDLIEISNIEKTKTNGGSKTSTSSTTAHVAIIDYLLINEKKYYLRDIEIDNDKKYLRNVCVQLIDGTLDCGIFQTGDGKKENSISVKLPNSGYYYLTSVDCQYYSGSSGSGLVIDMMDCELLMGKISDEDPSVTWKEGAPREERIQKFKTIVEEYNKCKLKK